MKTWEQVVSDPKYKDLSPEEQYQTREDYFGRFVAPKFNEAEHINAYREFIDKAQTLEDKYGTKPTLAATAVPVSTTTAPVPIIKQINLGHQAAVTNALKHIGVPYTGLDIGTLFNKMQLLPEASTAARAAEKAGGAAELTKLLTEIGLTSMAGGPVTKVVREAAVPLKEAVRRVAGSRLFQSGTQGATAGVLTGEDGPIANAAFGGATGALGDAITRPVAALATGFKNFATPAKELLRQNIPITLGQAQKDTLLGRLVRNFEDVSTSSHLVGPVIKAHKERGVTAIRQRFLKDSLPPGAKTPEGSLLEQVEKARDLFRTAYKKALSPQALTLPGVKATQRDLAMAVPPDFKQTLESVMFPGDRISNLTDAQRTRILDFVMSRFDKPSMAPYNVFAAQSMLKQEARRLTTGVHGIAQVEQADALNKAADHVLNGLMKGLPNAKELRDLNRRYKLFVNFERSVEKSKGLGDALPLRELRRVSAQAKRRDLNRLVRQGEEVLPSRVPDSGTGSRLAPMLLSGALGSAAGGYGSGYFGEGSVLPPGSGVAAGLGLGLSLPALFASPKLARYALGDYGAQKVVDEFLRKYLAPTIATTANQ